MPINANGSKDDDLKEAKGGKAENNEKDGW